MEIGIATDNTIPLYTTLYHSIPLYIPRFIEFVRAHSNVISCQQIKTQLRISDSEIQPEKTIYRLKNELWRILVTAQLLRKSNC